MKWDVCTEPKDTKRQHLPRHTLFNLLPSDNRYRSVHCHNTRLQSSSSVCNRHQRQSPQCLTFVWSHPSLHTLTTLLKLITVYWASIAKHASFKKFKIITCLLNILSPSPPSPPSRLISRSATQSMSFLPTWLAARQLGFCCLWIRATVAFCLRGCEGHRNTWMWFWSRARHGRPTTTRGWARAGRTAAGPTSALRPACWTTWER